LSAINFLAWVPLPDPGAPNNTIRINLSQYFLVLNPWA